MVNLPLLKGQRYPAFVMYVGYVRLKCFWRSASVRRMVVGRPCGQAEVRVKSSLRLSSSASSSSARLSPALTAALHDIMSSTSCRAASLSGLMLSCWALSSSSVMKFSGSTLRSKSSEGNAWIAIAVGDSCCASMPIFLRSGASC